jgi:hypothetical protein
MPFALSQLGSRVAARCKANDSLTACQFIAEESQPDGLSRVPRLLPMTEAVNVQIRRLPTSAEVHRPLYPASDFRPPSKERPWPCCSLVRPSSCSSALDP